jgi:crotonobetainyl-CoA:carnitine CoA-transferase CaiB-like acyl-CoA transferase
LINVAYAGTRVIEVASGLAAGVAGRFFADLGAEVVRVEAFEEPLSHPGDRAVVSWARAGKRVLSTPGSRGPGIEDLQLLLPGADLLITDMSPRRWAESFPSPESMVDDHPGMVLLDITRFGRVGPYVEYGGSDLVLLALSGYLFNCGLNDREPLRLGVDLVDIVTGVNAAGGAMTGLHHARRTGWGQVVEVSALRTMLCAGTVFPTSYSLQGIVRRRSSTAIGAVGIMLSCGDGHALVSMVRTSSEKLYLLLGDQRLLDEKFGDTIGRQLNQREMAEIMVEAAASRTMRELFETGQELRLQNAMVQSARQTPSDPQHRVRSFFQPLALESGTTMLAPVSPVLPVEARHERAHEQVETIETTAAARWRQERSAPQMAVAPSRNALEGLKVIELTFAWAGPFMGRILADHGARVVKIESRRYPDPARGVDLVDLSFGENDRWMDRSLAYIVANPGKYHVGMDLTNPEGKTVLLDLVRWADVIIENFTPRVLPNLQLGWDVFKSVNPSVIMISASGFGQEGPYRDYGAWGWGLECQAGITHATGYLGDPDPLLFHPTIPDPLSAAAGTAAILAALEERRRTGQGQRIDLSQYECATFATLTELLRAGDIDIDGPRMGNRHLWRAPQGVYPCQGADAWLAVAVETDEQWARLCEVIGRPDLAEQEHLGSHRGRQGEHTRIDEAVTAWTRGQTKHEAMHKLQDAGVPAGAVQNARDLHQDPQIQALEYFRAAWGRELGLRIWPGTWYGMQATPGDVRRGTSTFGEDNERVLRDLLRYNPDKVKMLLSSEAFSDVADGLESPTSPGVPVATMLQRGTILSWDDDYIVLPSQVAERNQRWRHLHSLPDVCFDGRAD